MYDLAIRNGLIVDGTRAPARRADLWIKDGRIAGIGRFDGEAAKEIDAAGKAVAPGFLDRMFYLVMSKEPDSPLK